MREKKEEKKFNVAGGAYPTLPSNLHQYDTPGYFVSYSLAL
jgi:hypothetical protein